MKHVTMALLKYFSRYFQANFWRCNKECSNPLVLWPLKGWKLNSTSRLLQPLPLQNLIFHFRNSKPQATPSHLTLKSTPSCFNHFSPHELSHKCCTHAWLWLGTWHKRSEVWWCTTLGFASQSVDKVFLWIAFLVIIA